MRPGDETEAESAQRIWKLLSSNISRLELYYNEAGVIYFVSTILHDPIITPDNTTLFNNAFNSSQQDTTIIIPQIHKLRNLLAQSKTFLQADDFHEFYRCNMVIATNLIPIENQIDALLLSAETLMTNDEEPDKNSCLSGETQNDLRILSGNVRFRAWALVLPEIQSGLELGIWENEDQAVGSLLRIEDGPV